MILKNKIIALNIVALMITIMISAPIIITMTDDNNLKTVLNFFNAQGNYAANYTKQHILSKAHSLYDIPEILNSDASYLCAVLEKTAQCRVQIYSGQTLIGDSEDLVLTNAPLRPEVNAAISGSAAYFINTDKPRTLYYAVPLAITGLNNYAIAFTQVLEAQNLMLSNIIRLFIFATALSGAFVIMTSIKISNRIIKPIDELYSATKSFSGGELTARVNQYSNDEIGELATSFNTMADSLESMFETLSSEQNKQKTFFDNFTHEIKTPLTTIIGYTDLLWKTDDENIKDKSLYYISSESKRMLKMIEHLLSLSRMKKYDFDVRMVHTNIREIIEFVCDSMALKANRYHIEFRLQLYDVTLLVDPDLFEQVLINVIDNAIKYSKTKTIDIALLDHEKTVSLSIKDYGIGISEEDLAHVFDPYYKVDKSRNSGSEGYGLGLSIVKEIITKHNADVKIYSGIDKGTTITIIFAKR